MKVKFVWATSGKNPQEVCDITLNVEQVPRCGELIDLGVQIEAEEWVHKSGRVTDVVWKFTGTGGSVTVFLGV